MTELTDLLPTPPQVFQLSYFLYTNSSTIDLGLFATLESAKARADEFVSQRSKSRRDNQTFIENRTLRWEGNARELEAEVADLDFNLTIKVREVQP